MEFDIHIGNLVFVQNETIMTAKVCQYKGLKRRMPIGSRYAE